MFGNVDVLLVMPHPCFICDKRSLQISHSPPSPPLRRGCRRWEWIMFRVGSIGHPRGDGVAAAAAAEYELQAPVGNAGCYGCNGVNVSDVLAVYSKKLKPSNRRLFYVGSSDRRGICDGMDSR
ncbi:hypothetical protein R5R35_006742 [Gryllus longicercus]|uniref:Uncharacterized protein n=1 Tax=Gryllus longicercus TaxID=2509291 RepID=A0AAN9W1J2_9ORTH